VGKRGAQASLDDMRLVLDDHREADVFHGSVV
jgi:hypothetical protein